MRGTYGMQGSTKGLGCRMTGIFGKGRRVCLERWAWKGSARPHDRHICKGTLRTAGIQQALTSQMVFFELVTIFISNMSLSFFLLP